MLGLASVEPDRTKGVISPGKYLKFNYLISPLGD